MPTPQQTSTGSGAGWSGNLGSLLQLGADAYGAYNASQLNSNANTVYQQSNPFGGYRPTYGAQLLSLLQNPSSVSSLPGYKFLLDQGVQAIDRSAAAPGGIGLGSGGEMMGLEKYGQGLADQFYSQQVATLAHLAGADISPANPYQALVGKGGAAGSMGVSLQGLASALPGGMNAAIALVKSMGELFGGSGAGQASDPAAMPAVNLGLDTSSGFGTFGSFADQTGFDPTTGGYSLPPSDPYSLDTGTNPFGMSSGYDATTGTYTDPTSGFDYSSITGGSGGDGGGGGMDLSGLFSGPFKAAGGEAAGSQLQQVRLPAGLTKLGSDLLSDSNTALGVYGAYAGLSSGSTVGEISGAVKAGQLAEKAGLISRTGTAASALGAVGAGLGAYESALRGDQNGGYLASGVDAGIAGASLAGDTALASSLGPVGLAFSAVMGLDSALNGDEARSSAELTYETNAAHTEGNAYAKLTSGASPTAYLPIGNGGTSSAGWGYDMNQLNPDLRLSALIASNLTPTGGANAWEAQKWAQTDPAQFYKMLQQLGPTGLRTYGITADSLAAAGYSQAQIAALGLV